jgi:hypothetical protein
VIGLFGSVAKSRDACDAASTVELVCQTKLEGLAALEAYQRERRKLLDEAAVCPTLPGRAPARLRVAAAAVKLIADSSSRNQLVRRSDRKAGPTTGMG